jgi:hypothetical protein
MPDSVRVRWKSTRRPQFDVSGRCGAVAKMTPNEAAAAITTIARKAA